MPRSSPQTKGRGSFPGRRWLIVVLRALHLIAVIALGALLLGAPAAPGWSHGTVSGLVVATGPAPWLFWALVALSAVVSHAPASFRHAELF